MMFSNMVRSWKAGEVVVLRGVWHQKLWWACAANIVQDTPELIAMYWRAGTPNMIPARRPRPHDLLSDDILLIPHNWTETDVLMLVTPGASHAVYAMWETGQKELRCWYIDLQEPLRRTVLGFDTMDHLLDVVISADQSAWHWKDEDEFEQAVAIGVYSTEEARSIRAEGERALNLCRTRQSPFCDGWEKWFPPAEWDIPAMPEGWDKIQNR
jgi:hypothetical protein